PRAGAAPRSPAAPAPPTAPLPPARRSLGPRVGASAPVVNRAAGRRLLQRLGDGPVHGSRPARGPRGSEGARREAGAGGGGPLEGGPPDRGAAGGPRADELGRGGQEARGALVVAPVLRDDGHTAEQPLGAPPVPEVAAEGQALPVVPGCARRVGAGQGHVPEELERLGHASGVPEP